MWSAVDIWEWDVSCVLTWNRLPSLPPLYFPTPAFLLSVHLLAPTLPPLAILPSGPKPLTTKASLPSLCLNNYPLFRAFYGELPCAWLQAISPSPHLLALLWPIHWLTWPFQDLIPLWSAYVCAQQTGETKSLLCCTFGQLLVTFHSLLTWADIINSVYLKEWVGAF